MKEPIEKKRNYSGPIAATLVGIVFGFLFTSIFNLCPHNTKIYKRMVPGNIFYAHWGYPDDLRRYSVIDTNANGYYVKWLDERGIKTIEFMPNEITGQPQYKLLKP